MDSMQMDVLRQLNRSTTLSRWASVGTCILLALGLNACQRAPKSFTPYSQATAKKLSHLETFKVAGKLSFKQEDKGGNAKFIWQQRGKAFTLRLFNPLGGEEARLQYEGGLYRLKVPGEPWQESAQIEPLFEQHLGWYAPVGYLPYWLKGVPGPQSPNRLIKRVSEVVIVQGGWEVTYDQTESIQSFTVPTSLRFQQTTGNKHTRVKMTLRWDIP